MVLSAGSKPVRTGSFVAATATNVQECFECSFGFVGTLALPGENVLASKLTVDRTTRNKLFPISAVTFWSRRGLLCYPWKSFVAFASVKEVGDAVLDHRA